MLKIHMHFTHVSFFIYPNNKYHPTPVDLIVEIVLPVLFLCIIIGGAVYYSIAMNKVSTYTDPSKCINDHTLRSDTEFCRTCRECHSYNCPRVRVSHVGVRVSTLR